MTLIPPLIKALQTPACYPHPTHGIRLLETHISWVLLTGEYAYKIKKPLDLGFLDFTSLAQRRHYCEQELMLNRRLAPQVYHEVVAIRGSQRQPHLGGDGDILEYAVKMRQFEPSQQLDARLQRQELAPADIDQLAAIIAHFHAQAEVAADTSHFGNADTVLAAAQQNFDQIHSLLPAESAHHTALKSLATWFEQQTPTLRSQFSIRKQQGHVRNCHGDMHLGNMTTVDGEVIIFDCIEFNDDFRWMDTISELAFVTMDLHHRGQHAYAHRLLDCYLTLSGDYSGLCLLRFYQAYYAMVRAKVAAIRASQSQAENDWAEHDTYLALAQGFARPTQAQLFITHGLSGSGKSSISQPLLEAYGLIRLRSDVERKRLYGLAAHQRSSSVVDQGIYSSEASEKTYQHLATTAQQLLNAGYAVIVDATFLRFKERLRFAQLAAAMPCPFFILHFHAPVETLKQWIREREAIGTDASEATVDVLEKQLLSQEALTPTELATTISIDSVDLNAAEKLIAQLQPTLETTKQKTHNSL